MTTDQDKFCALMAEFGLVPEKSDEGAQGTRFTLERPQPNVVGCASSVAIFSFNLDGSFKDIGVWE